MTTLTSGLAALNLRTRPSIVRPSGPLKRFQNRRVTPPSDEIPTSSQPPSASDDAAAPIAAARNARRGTEGSFAEVGSARAMPLYVSHPMPFAKHNEHQTCRACSFAALLLLALLPAQRPLADASPPASQLATYQNPLDVRIADP